MANVPKYDNVQGRAIFETAPVRQNLTSGEPIPTSFSKIKKWFADLDEIFTPMSESEYEQLTEKDLPIYLIYED